MDGRRLLVRRLILQASGVILLIFIGAQFIRPKLNDPPVTAEIVAPPEVKSIFRHSCDLTPELVQMGV